MLSNGQSVQSVKVVLSFLLMLFLMGCSVSPYRYGKQALEMGDYQRAIMALQKAVRAEPAKPHPWREFGIAYYQLGEDAEAKLRLERAYHINPLDVKTTLYLAMTCERRAQYKQAIAIYDYLAQIAHSMNLRGLVAFHSIELKERWHQQLASDLLIREAEIAAEQISAQAIAVMPIANLDGDAETTELAGTLTYLVSEMLSGSTGWEITDMLLVHRLIRELGLGVTDAIDVTLGERAGRLLGAGVVVTGTLKKMEAGKFRFNLTLMQMHGGAMREFDAIVETPADFAQSVHPLADWILGISTPPSEALTSQMPMQSPEALLVFARGRRFFDAGEYGKATESFRRAIESHPNFSQAKLLFSMAEVLMEKRFKAVTAGELERDFIRAEAAMTSRYRLLQLADAQVGGDFIAVGTPQQVRGNGNQKFPGSDLPFTIHVQWE